MGEGTAFFIAVIATLVVGFGNWWTHPIGAIVLIAAWSNFLVVVFVERTGGPLGEAYSRWRLVRNRHREELRQQKQQLKHPARYARKNVPQSVDFATLTTRHHEDWQTIIDRRQQQSGGSAGRT